MKNKLFNKIYLDSFIKNIEIIKDYKFGKLHIYILYILQISEYVLYICTIIVIFIGIICSGRLIKKFYDNKQKSKISTLMQVRFTFGQILNVSLTLILAGHIIKLIHTSTLQTIFFLVIIIFVRELMSNELDKESQALFKSYEAQLFFEEQKKKGLQKIEKQFQSKINKEMNNL